MDQKEGGLPIVRMKTSKGTIEIELFQKDAPGTVANFVGLVQKGFYDGIHFHRVIPEFVIQGGCPNAKVEGARNAGTGGPGYTIKCETRGNKRTHKVGALSMAHAGRDTGGSQFFIVLDEGNTQHLNGVHTVFGHVTGGLDVVRNIAAAAKNDSRGNLQAPWTKIEKATVEA